MKGSPTKDVATVRGHCYSGAATHNVYCIPPTFHKGFLHHWCSMPCRRKLSILLEKHWIKNDNDNSRRHIEHLIVDFLNIPTYLQNMVKWCNIKLFFRLPTCLPLNPAPTWEMLGKMPRHWSYTRCCRLVVLRLVVVIGWLCYCWQEDIGPVRWDRAQLPPRNLGCCEGEAQDEEGEKIEDGRNTIESYRI